MIGMLFSGLALHDNSLAYEALPSAWYWGGRGQHNSNSFFAGLANHAGLTLPSFPVPTPGVENPVPIGR